jgi:sugar phosphate permease
MTSDVPALKPFSRYQKFVVGLLATLQFAVIIDFMLMAPLGAMIMPALQMSARQFGFVVSAYAFSAGLAGLMTAGFADRFDRKKLLLFFYSGFVIGTLWCGLAASFETLLLARVVTGIFAGVIGSIVLAIAADLFAPQSRGRVMGVIQTAFAASQVMGRQLLHLQAGEQTASAVDSGDPAVVDRQRDDPPGRPLRDPSRQPGGGRQTGARDAGGAAFQRSFCATVPLALHLGDRDAEAAQTLRP